jgi:hypothetical protein
MNLVYRYTTDHDTCDIIIYNDELSKIFWYEFWLQQKIQVNLKTTDIHH